jgi:hypothetical protein
MTTPEESIQRLSGWLKDYDQEAAIAIHIGDYATLSADLHTLIACADLWRADSAAAGAAFRATERRYHEHLATIRDGYATQTKHLEDQIATLEGALNTANTALAAANHKTTHQ